MEEAYTKRELDQKFASFTDKNDAWNSTIMEKLDDLDKYRLTPIHEQVIRTNGRVDNLEKWRVWLTGCAVILVPISTWLFYNWLSLTDQINTKVDARFETYRIQGTVTEQ